jgi:hypothetical protein
MKANSYRINKFLQKCNIVEVEFWYQDSSRTKRKLSIPHGQYLPPLVLRDDHADKWFSWDKPSGVYREVSGDTISNIEVVNGEN